MLLFNGALDVHIVDMSLMSYTHTYLQVKVIRKFFLNHNKSFRWHLGDYENIIFFPFEGL